MTFKELLNSVQFEDVAPHIVRMYPDMEKSIGWYKIHFDMLRLMNPVYHEDANDKVCNITIDANDIRDSLDCDGTLAVNDIRISAKVNDRMKELVGQIEKMIENNATVKSLLFHLFFPEELPLQMSELQPLSDWLSSFQFDTDFKVRWGMVSTSHSQEPLLRAIVLAVT